MIHFPPLLILQACLKIPVFSDHMNILLHGMHAEFDVLPWNKVLMNFSFSLQ